ncbi:hypothetical protein F66182_1049 [Fusarium sp. NRRL 66182]|nr:hypothetical protein F66182_1049 [Fusarium sp. NRRL 66182]
MLSLKGLLNPAPPGDDAPPFSRPSPAPESPTISNVGDASNQALSRSMMHPFRATVKDTSNLAKSKLRGQVRFPPFEHLNEAALHEMQRFRVSPFGFIHETCLHIPYNSGKKDFFEKTGRESFEGELLTIIRSLVADRTNLGVFKYEFVSPEDGVEYAVMWDYNVGLVRMTPFFKCRNYGKTMPAKMLGLNPGLKEITHSITGGSIAAQGYWMPYQCARAVCATFCFPIAGALIPIFGPTFPSACTHPSSPDFGRMIISPQLVVDATREADMTRRMHMNTMAPSFHGTTSFPRDDRGAPQSIHPQEERKHRFRPRLVCDPSWGVDNDNDPHYMSAPNSASSTGSGLPVYMVTSRPSSSWTCMSQSSPEPNPWLSAIPRVQPLQHGAAPPTSGWSSKRRLEQEDWECSYRGSASPNMSASSVMMAPTPEASPMRQRELKEPQGVPDTVQKNAAMLLLNLSTRDPGSSASIAVGSPPVGSMRPQVDVPTPEDEHRSKRQRACSF